MTRERGSTTQIALAAVMAAAIGALGVAESRADPPSRAAATEPTPVIQSVLFLRA
jgi:hypothetical protein